MHPAGAFRRGHAVPDTVGGLLQQLHGLAGVGYLAAAAISVALAAVAVAVLHRRTPREAAAP